MGLYDLHNCSKCTNGGGSEEWLSRLRPGHEKGSGFGFVYFCGRRLWFFPCMVLSLRVLPHYLELCVIYLDCDFGCGSRRHCRSHFSSRTLPLAPKEAIKNAKWIPPSIIHQFHRAKFAKQVLRSLCAQTEQRQSYKTHSSLSLLNKSSTLPNKFTINLLFSIQKRVFRRIRKHCMRGIELI